MPLSGACCELVWCEPVEALIFTREFRLYSDDKMLHRGRGERAPELFVHTVALFAI